MLPKVKGLLERFFKDDEGVIAIELLLVSPIIAWALLSTVMYLDVYRDKASAYRASLVLADMISRETVPITEDYLDSTIELLYELVSTPEASLRVTAYYFDDGDSEYKRVWSKIRVGTSGQDFTEGELTTAVLNSVDVLLPDLADQDSSYAIEIIATHRPVFFPGMAAWALQDDMGNVTFQTFTVTRPRFSNGVVCFENGDGSEDCGPWVSTSS